MKTNIVINISPPVLYLENFGSGDMDQNAVS